MTLNTGCILPW